MRRNRTPKRESKDQEKEMLYSQAKALEKELVHREGSRMQGTVIFYNPEKGFGYIRQDESDENIFFHKSDCNDILRAQMRVQYAIAEGSKGLKAVNVSII